MHLHDLSLAVVAFVSEILGVLSGFGSSTFFVPIGILVESFKLILVLSAILHCFGNLFKIIIFRKDFKWPVFFQLAAPSVIFTAIGAFLTTKFSSDLMIRCLGLFLMFFALLTFVFKKQISLMPRWISIFLSAISGFSTGFVGTGGAIRGLAMTALQLPKNSFVAISSAIDIGGDALRAIVYLQNGFMDWGQWFYIPLLAIAAFAGARVGKKILSHINQNQFEKIVAVFIFLSGLMMLIEA